MKKTLNTLAGDGVMAALLFFGEFQGNEYASNVFWPIFWVFVLISIAGLFAFHNEDFKSKFKEDRTPTSTLMIRFSFLYDTVFSLCLAALGFAWSAGIWWVLQFFNNTALNALDEEIRQQQNNAEKETVLK